MKKQLLKSMLMAVVGVGMLALNSYAYTISHLNSTADINANGWVSWTVDGVSQLFQANNFYRIGNSSSEANLGTLTSAVDAGSRFLSIDYTLEGIFTANVTYTILGGATGSGFSDMSQQFSITNLTNSALDFHFFQYTDFDLSGTISNDLGQHLNESNITQSDNRTQVTTTFATPSRWQISPFSNILTSLQDGSATDLDNTVLSGGPYDATWAIQNDWTIGAGSTVGYSSDSRMTAVPEPATMLLFGTGIAGLAGIARRRKTN